MSTNFQIFLSFAVLLCILCLSLTTAVEIDCEKPPKLANLTSCCQDDGHDAVVEACAKRFGLTGQPNDLPLTVQTAMCLSECILTESHYMQQKEKLSLETIRNDLQQKFANDSIYAQTVFESFKKCEPRIQREMETFKQISLGNAQLQRGCSPYSSMILGCVSMEYFTNCPANRWTENADCAVTKQFVAQCILAARN